jgi:hypothetical protein
MYPDETLTFSYSHLGKFIAILLIIFATCINVFYGTFLCALFVLYYQSDMVEGMIMYESNETIKPKTKSQVDTKNGELVSNNDNNGFEILDFIVDPPDPDIEIEIEDTGLNDAFTYTEKDKFRKQHCVNGELNINIQSDLSLKTKHEFADAIFPGLEFKNENICNPCDPNCNFSFDENRLYNKA